MTMEQLTPYTPYIFGTITTLVAYVLGTGKRKADIKKTDEESKHTHLENVESALEIYRGMLDKLKKNLDEAEAAYEKALITVSILKKENRRLKERNKNLEQAIRTCDFKTCQTLNDKP